MRRETFPDRSPSPKNSSVSPSYAGPVYVKNGQADGTFVFIREGRNRDHARPSPIADYERQCMLKTDRGPVTGKVLWLWRVASAEEAHRENVPSLGDC